jgi:hypothetical protein
MHQSTASTAIGQKAAKSIYYAVEQAARIRRPITHLVTINFAATNCEVGLVCAAFSKLRLNHFNKWATRPNQGLGAPLPPTYLYAFENERFDTPIKMAAVDCHNVHVHWAVHIPSNRIKDFEESIWRWLEEVSGGINDGRAIDIRIADDVRGLRSYLLKGTQTAWAALYGATAKPQGEILGGRRSGTSRNLASSARIKLDRLLGVRRRIPQRRNKPIS